MLFEISLLNQHKIKHILSVGCEPEKSASIEYTKIDLMDLSSASILQHFDFVFELITSCLNLQKPILVHWF